MPKNESPEAICSQVARLLKKNRVAQGISVNLLAQRAGLSRQAITFIEQEMRTPNLDTLLRHSRALGVDLESLIAEARKHASGK